MHGGVLHGALLDFGDAAWDGDDNAGTDKTTVTVRLGDEMPEHRLGDFKVRDNTILEWTDGRDVARGTAKHSLRLIADGQHLCRARLDSDNGGFTKDDAVIFDIDQRVGCTEIDTDVAGEEAEEIFKHGMRK